MAIVIGSPHAVIAAISLEIPTQLALISVGVFPLSPDGNIAAGLASQLCCHCGWGWNSFSIIQLSHKPASHGFVFRRLIGWIWAIHSASALILQNGWGQNDGSLCEFLKERQAINQTQTSLPIGKMAAGKNRVIEKCLTFFLISCNKRNSKEISQCSGKKLKNKSR